MSPGGRCSAACLELLVFLGLGVEPLLEPGGPLLDVVDAALGSGGLKGGEVRN